MDFLFSFGIKEWIFWFSFGIKEFQEKIRTYTYKEKTHENLIIITIDQVVLLLLCFQM
jgi:hypothetical protein